MPSHRPEAGFALYKPQCCVGVGSVEHSQPFFLKELPNPKPQKTRFIPDFSSVGLLYLAIVPGSAGPVGQWPRRLVLSGHFGAPGAPILYETAANLWLKASVAILAIFPPK